jgi:hypothetical protein
MSQNSALPSLAAGPCRQFFNLITSLLQETHIFTHGDSGLLT